MNGRRFDLLALLFGTLAAGSLVLDCRERHVFKEPRIDPVVLSLGAAIDRRRPEPRFHYHRLAVGFGLVSVAVLAVDWHRRRRRLALTSRLSEERESDAVWVAARELAREHRHDELDEEHLFVALLFDDATAAHFAEQGVDIDVLESVMTERLEARGSSNPSHYRSGLPLDGPVSASLQQRLPAGGSHTVATLLNAVLAAPSPNIARAILDARRIVSPPRADAAMDVVVLGLTRDYDRARVLDWLHRHFGLSRARAAFVIERAVLKGRAVVTTFSQRAGAAHALEAAGAAARAAGVRCPFALLPAGSAAQVRPTSAAAKEEPPAAEVRAVTAAAKLSAARGHPEVVAAHVTLVLLQREDIAARLQRVGGDLEAAKRSLEASLDKQSRATSKTSTRVAVKLNRARSVARTLGRASLDTADIMKVLYDGEDAAPREAFAAAGLCRATLLAALLPSIAPVEEDGAGHAERSEIVLHDDSITTMEQVVAMLRQVFAMDDAHAMALMLRVHREGEAVIETCATNEAGARVEQARDWARAAGAPLRISSRPVRPSTLAPL